MQTKPGTRHLLHRSLGLPSSLFDDVQYFVIPVRAISARMYPTGRTMLSRSSSFELFAKSRMSSIVVIPGSAKNNGAPHLGQCVIALSLRSAQPTIARTKNTVRIIARTASHQPTIQLTDGGPTVTPNCQTALQGRHSVERLVR